MERKFDTEYIPTSQDASDLLNCDQAAIEEDEELGRAIHVPCGERAVNQASIYHLPPLQFCQVHTDFNHDALVDKGWTIKPL